MKKRKLKGFVLPSIYLVVTISVFIGIILLGSSFELDNKDYDYGVETLSNTIIPVNNEDNLASTDIKEPIEEGKSSILIHYYNYKDDEQTQQNSLIYYENTYLPNTGILYADDNEFNVLSVFAGKVIDILDDEFFDKVLVIEHNKSLKTYYYGLKDIEVSVGDEVTTGTVLGVSKNNNIMNTKKTFLLEVYYNNKLINPEKFIGTKITDYE